MAKESHECKYLIFFVLDKEVWDYKVKDNFAKLYDGNSLIKMPDTGIIQRHVFIFFYHQPLFFTMFKLKREQNIENEIPFHIRHPTKKKMMRTY